MSKVTDYFEKHESSVLYRDSLAPSVVGYASHPPYCGHVRLRLFSGMLIWMTPQHFRKRFVRHVRDIPIGDSPPCHE